MGMMTSVCYSMCIGGLFSAGICFLLIFLCCSSFRGIPASAWSPMAAVSLLVSQLWHCNSWGFSRNAMPPAPTVPSSDLRVTLSQSSGTAWSDAVCRSWLRPSTLSRRHCTVLGLPRAALLPSCLCTALLCAMQVRPGL